MSERVRLVIWDLDGTFWQGTLTEGGILYDQIAHDTVITLAERGIVSSICSKNDLEHVQGLLETKEIWNYFVLPSVNWEPKGPRLAAMIEAFGLRPASVLFIDDNHLNLEEARHHVPGIQTADHNIVSLMLRDERFKGKDDRILSRLEQYKLLEQRASDAAVSGGDNIAFLRSCDIRVTIEHDVEPHLNRVIELVNRTNQLNFTKQRLPENLDDARVQLLAQLRHSANQAALIKVTDRYGDHGYVGFYMMHRVGNNRRRLAQFCFSCRILNMHVEHWVYRLLGCPALKIAGPVVSNPLDSGYEIDWINHEKATAGETNPIQAGLPDIYARGGCNLAAVTHYFSLCSKKVVPEWNSVRHGIPIRIDHSLLLRYAVEGVANSLIDISEPLGYRPEDFHTAAFGRPADGSPRLLACWADADVSLYRHRGSGHVLPFWLLGVAGPRDLTKYPHPAEEQLESGAKSALAYLRAEFEHVGLQDLETLEKNVASIAGNVPKTDTVYILLPNSQNKNGTNPYNARLRTWLASAAARFCNFQIVDVQELLRGPDEIHDVNHFDRMVYFRVYEHIRRLITERVLEPA